MNAETFLSKLGDRPAAVCWIWKGYLRKGYGTIFFMGKHIQTHVLAYRLFRGPIPEGTELDHLCRNRACCNPAHLEPVSHKVNCLRGTSFAAINAKKTHCPKGHEYTTDNTYYFLRDGKPYRRCKTCHNAKRKQQHLNAKIRKTTGEQA